MDKVQFTVRIPKKYIQKLSYIANDNSRTLNGEVIKLMRESVSLFEKEHGPIALRKEEK